MKVPDEAIEAAYEWRGGRMINPAAPGICIHMVGTTPGLWCGACNGSWDHPDRADALAPQDTDDERGTT